MSINTSPQHKFHVPVMGLGYSIDSPVKIAHYGIDSVISIVDDDLIEKMREVHCERSGTPYKHIPNNDEDHRAKRIKEYLNLISDIVNRNFETLKNSYGQEKGEFEKYIYLLPDNNNLKRLYNNAVENDNLDEVKEDLLSMLNLGGIDVNIMTKVDKTNYNKDGKLPVIYNDAHASLRGFAESKLNSSIILSAGMNPRLYSYFEEFDDFYPDKNGELKKKIVLKVSDYRSALIQGKFLAKKGLWVSEYRIESGLNCGGHAFATDGYLMGPILNEFKINRNELRNTIHSIYIEALTRKEISYNGEPFEQRITAQGGIGTSEEQNFLIDHFDIDSAGWGTPFLLVPEVTNVDEDTIKLLSGAREEDLYLSNISPLGVPFNSLKGNTKDIEKYENALEGRPGSPCPKKFLQFNTEFSEKPICSASRTFQSKKIKQLEEQSINDNQFTEQYEKVIEKSCLCVGLASSTLQNCDAATKADGNGVLICPGPNLAYFSSVVSLKDMVDHIYGRKNIIKRTDRPNMFIKELKLYINYLDDKISELNDEISSGQRKYITAFINNLEAGISYYFELFNNLEDYFKDTKLEIIKDLRECEKNLIRFAAEFDYFSVKSSVAVA